MVDKVVREIVGGPDGGGRLLTPRDAWWAGNWVTHDEPDIFPYMAITTVIAGQGMPSPVR